MRNNNLGKKVAKVQNIKIKIILSIVIVLIITILWPQSSRHLKAINIQDPPIINDEQEFPNCYWEQTIGGPGAPSLIKYMKEQQKFDFVWCDEPPNGFDKRGVPLSFKRNGEIIGCQLHLLPGYSKP